MTFGSVVAEARKSKNLSLKELAALILKDDGTPISPQYLNDIEHDRRHPPSDLIMYFAEALDIPIATLFAYVGELTPEVRDELRQAAPSPDTVDRAYKAFRKALHGDRA